jgi:hypothetical protein
MLFRVKDAVAQADNDPEFHRLFVQGVGNYLTGFANATAQISRERALELEAFIADNKANIGRFMGSMAKSAPNAFGKVFGRKNAQPEREAQVSEARAVTSDEQTWLDAQIAANGEIDAFDQALINFLAEENGQA